jgi:hypothetical protein
MNEGTTTLSITTFSIMSLGITATLINDSRKNVTLVQGILKGEVSLYH